MLGGPQRTRHNRGFCALCCNVKQVSKSWASTLESAGELVPSRPELFRVSSWHKLWGGKWGQKGGIIWHFLVLPMQKTRCKHMRVHFLFSRSPFQSKVWLMNCKALQASGEILVFSTIGSLGAFKLLNCTEDPQRGVWLSGLSAWPWPLNPFLRGHLTQLECLSMHSANCRAVQAPRTPRTPRTPRIHGPRGLPLRVEKHLS